MSTVMYTAKLTPEFLAACTREVETLSREMAEQFSEGVLPHEAVGFLFGQIAMLRVRVRDLETRLSAPEQPQ